MLFKNYQYFAYEFPEPQYLGAKYTLLKWLIKYIPKNIHTTIDAFAGSQSVAYLFKQLGFQVFTNDFLQFNHQIGKSLIENKNQFLDKKDLEILFQNSSQKEDFTLIQNLYTNLFFEEEQAIFLDNCRANIQFLENEYKKSFAISLINRSLQRKITMGHFGHTQALVYAGDKERIKRNPNLVRPIRDIFMDLLPRYNKAIFDNGQENKSFSENILDLLPKILEKSPIDLIYFDPPYCDSHADYQSFYHLAETYTEYWQDKQFINGIKRYEPQKFSGFDKKKDVVQSFHTLFEMSKEIPNWLMSYNDRSFPTVHDLTNIIKQYKKVEVVTKTYQNGRGGKGSVAGSQEVLFICKPKSVFNISFEMKNQKQSFSHWKNLYDTDHLEDFNFNLSALLWLKVKSITRKEILHNFLNTNNIFLKEKGLNQQFEELYNLLSDNLEQNHQKLNDFIHTENQSQETILDTEKLVSELYKLRHFDWGGDYKNQLDKFLVDRYVKVYQNYDILLSKFDTDINRAVQGYVLCSWYNHWSSILIEHIFKSHSAVLPTVGQIKKVDFFVNEVPFDLKVTYLPANFIEKQRKLKGLKPELTELKQKAKQAQLSFTNHSKADDTYYEIVEKMKDRNDTFCKETLQNIKQIRLNILKEVQENPKILIQNLYEEQGELRFDASNRLFLVLVDTEDFDNSWKLKRNLELLRPNIQTYLNDFSTKNIPDLKITFDYKNKGQFTALSDIIFVTK